MDQRTFLGLLDMFDGGGAGRSGDTFQGGLLSGLLNELGARPVGYNERMAAQAAMPAMPVQPVMRGNGAPAASPRPMFRPGPAAPTMTTLPPPGAQMSDEELIRMVLQALQGPPSLSGYGPR